MKPFVDARSKSDLWGDRFWRKAADGGRPAMPQRTLSAFHGLN
jgi:hypothetical protein